MLEIIVAFSLLPSLLGLLVLYHVSRPQKPPADNSNRINKVRLVWFALTREDLLAQKIEWLKKDEAENVGWR